MKKIKLGYCMINNPFSEEGETMLFVSTPNSPSMNTEIFDQPMYTQACVLLKNLGFVQTELLTFESIRGAQVDLEFVHNQLQENGLKYNKNLEASILKELKAVAKEAEKELIKDATLDDSLVDITNYLKTKKRQIWPMQINPTRLPGYGETVELYFYLFLETSLLKDGEILFMLNGDFYSRKGDKQRKFIKIIGAKFRRIDTGNPSELHFESVSKYKDFLDDIDCLYTANLEFQPQGLLGYENTVFKKQYSIMEIKDVINLENYIVVNVNSASHFGKLLNWSNKIKNELLEQKDNKVPVEFLVARTKEIVERLYVRMDKAIEIEAYEAAQSYKNSIETLNKRVEWLQESGKQTLNLMEYDYHMSLGQNPLE